ncbi:MAG: hypothetical protein V3T82_07780, partial [Nitrospinaceae bacterium]
MTRYQFLRFLLFSIFSLMVYPLRAPAARTRFPPEITGLRHVYGIKQVKWIREIEVSNETHTGYWEKRNWSRDGKVKIISRIDFPKNGS